MHRLALVALVVAAYGGWHWGRSERAVHRPPGMVAPGEPVQVDLDPPPRFEAKGYTFVKRAKFDIPARLLRKEAYHLDGGAGPRAGRSRRRLGSVVEQRDARRSRVFAD